MAGARQSTKPVVKLFRGQAGEKEREKESERSGERERKEGGGRRRPGIRVPEPIFTDKGRRCNLLGPVVYLDTSCLYISLMPFSVFPRLPSLPPRPVSLSLLSRQPPSSFLHSLFISRTSMLRDYYVACEYFSKYVYTYYTRVYKCVEYVERGV